MQYKIYKFRLYPSKRQKTKLLYVLETCRLFYNSLLGMWNDNDKISSYYELQAMLPLLKEKNKDFKKINSKILQMIVVVLYNNLKILNSLKKKKGRKVGKLRYKKYEQYRSFILNQSGFKFLLRDSRVDRVRISKVGEIPIRMHCGIYGKIKQLVIKRYKTGEWYGILYTDEEIPTVKQNIEKVIGLDVGIKFFLSDSDGRQVENPKFYKKALGQIKIEQKKLSHKKKDSNNYKRQMLRLAKLHQRLTNQRNDFLHKLSRFYVNSYDFISIENLSINNMVRNHCFAQLILDASWGKFFGMLSYKAESAGKIVTRINPRGTSKEHKYGIEIDRDYNASLNILERGMLRQGLPFEPLEIEPLRELMLIPASSVVEGGSLI